MQLFSVSKSVTSMLVGIALADGAIGSVKDRVTDYRRDFAGTAYEETTLAELLDMTSGVGDAEVWDVPDSGIKRFERAVMGGGDVAEVIRVGSRARRRPASASTTPRSTPRFSAGCSRRPPAGPWPGTPSERLWSQHRRRPRRLLLAHPGPPPHRDRRRLVQRHRPRRRPPRPADGQRRRRRRQADRAPRLGAPQPRQRPAPARRRRARPERIRPLRLRQPVVDPRRAAAFDAFTGARASTASTSSSTRAPTS